MAFQPRLMLEEAALSFEGTFLPSSAVIGFGTTVIVAPHPDDETLGCGGLIALLREHGLRVGVVVMTDGGNSHPNSQEFSRERIGGIRERETLAALEILGVPASDVQFLGYSDGQLANQASADFDGAVDCLRGAIAASHPQTVVMPFRGEHHADHLATWHLSRYATKQLASRPRRLEYPLMVGPAARAIFQLQNPKIWKLDVSAVLSRKLGAVNAHRTQLGGVIRDDPGGYRFGRRLLENTLRGYESYFEFPDT
ncbi:MAG: PIG-L deacetylase family protein [Vulcanimicrobiaceae bacterium]